MFVAGPYSAVYGSDNLGVTERGFELEYTHSEEPIVGDNLGESVQDDVYTGINAFLNFVLQEYNLVGVRKAFWPMSTTLGEMGLVGSMKWDFCPDSGLVLTAVSGTRAFLAGPKTITFPKVILAGGASVRLLFGTRHRNVPMRLRVYPYYAGATHSPVVIPQGALMARAVLFTTA